MKFKNKIDRLESKMEILFESKLFIFSLGIVSLLIAVSIIGTHEHGFQSSILYVLQIIALIIYLIVALGMFLHGFWEYFLNSDSEADPGIWRLGALTIYPLCWPLLVVIFITAVWNE